MVKENIVCGVDIGSGQVSCVIADLKDDGSTVEVLSSGQDICRGVKGGVVIDINETAGSIRNAIEEAEEKSGKVVNEIILGVRGEHIQTHQSRGVISISRTDKEITTDDITSVIDNAKAEVQISHDREIIDILIQEFSLDRQKGVHNPVGMEGNFLEVYVLIVTASVTQLNNIFKAVAKAGFQITDLVYGLLATAETVVAEEEKESGCLVIDMGGHTTGLSVYSEKSMRFSKEITFGSDMITKDILYALRTSFGQAKYIKEKFGTALMTPDFEDAEIDYTGMDGRTVRKVTRRKLTEIVAPRVEEIFEKVISELENTSFMDAIVPGGVILSGGGSMLKGITEACNKIMLMETRRGLPQGVTGKSEIINNPVFTTAISLLKYRPGVDTFKKQKYFKKSSFLKKLRDWI